MSEFVLNEEAFKLGVMEKVPSPQEGECFLLFQSGAGVQDSMIINYGAKYSSTDVRHKRYNQKITLSLKEKEFNQSYHVVMKDKNFRFDVSVKMSYSLQNVRAYFFQGKMEEEDILHVVRNAVRQQDGKWKVWEDIELQNTLENEIEKRLKRYEGVSFKRIEVHVTPEEAAVKMRDSNKEKIVKIHVSQNETDEQIARNNQAERILDSEQKLKMKQIGEMALLWKNFGNMSPIVEEYFKGNISGKELYDYLGRDRAEKMSMLQTAVSGDMLTQKETMEKINEIFANNEFLQAADQKQLPSGEVSRLEEKNGEDAGSEKKNEGEKIREAEQAEEKVQFEDGDYIS